MRWAGGDETFGESAVIGSGESGILLPLITFLDQSLTFAVYERTTPIDRLLFSFCCQSTQFLHPNMGIIGIMV